MALFDIHHPFVFAFGILGNLVSICVYLAPLPTFIRIYKEKSTMGFQSIPYIIALFSAMLWMYYALLKDALLLISINSLGCIVETIYIFVYLLYAAKEARKQTTMLLAGLNVGMFAAVFLLTHFVVEGQMRIAVVGWICAAFSVGVFAAPLTIVFQVVRTRSAEFMPFSLSFALTLSAVVWFSYGLLQKDICVAVPNILGFILGLLQMVLYGMYRNHKPINVAVEEKMPEHVINIVMLGKSEQVHKLDSQTSSSSDEAAIDEDDDDDDDDEKNKHGETNMINGSASAPADEPSQSQVNVQLNSPIIVVCAA